MSGRYSLAVPLVLSVLVHAAIIGVGEFAGWGARQGERKPFNVEYRLQGPAADAKPTAAAADGRRESVGSESISLEAPDPSYRPYFQVLRRMIGDRWREPRAAGGGSAESNLVVEFALNSDGTLLVVSVERSSGERELDVTAVEAVKEAAPFPPFPPEISESELTIRALFVYD